MYMCPLSLALNSPDKCDSLKHVTAFDPLLYHQVTLSDTFVSVRSTVIPRYVLSSYLRQTYSLNEFYRRVCIHLIRSFACSFACFSMSSSPYFIVWGKVKQDKVIVFGIRYG